MQLDIYCNCSISLLIKAASSSIPTVVPMAMAQYSWVSWEPRMAASLPVNLGGYQARATSLRRNVRQGILPSVKTSEGLRFKSDNYTTNFWSTNQTAPRCQPIVSALETDECEENENEPEENLDGSPELTELEQPMVQELPAKEPERDFSGTPYVPVYVMLPLGIINDQCQLVDPDNLRQSLRSLKSANVDGIMVDCWWGIVEGQSPLKYNWSGYRELFNIVHEMKLKLQVVMSLHECGGNVGDDVNIPLPNWILDIGEDNPDIFFTDRKGRRNMECLSWGIDKERVLRGRTGLEVFRRVRVAKSSLESKLQVRTSKLQIHTRSCSSVQRVASLYKLVQGPYVTLLEFWLSVQCVARVSASPYSNCRPVRAAEYLFKIQVCFDYMRSFRMEFNDYFEDDLISEIEIGLGPCGELRYPSYPGRYGWKYPGIGEFQCYDKYLQKNLRKAAEARGHPFWARGPDNAGHYNSMPQDTGFFRDGGDYDSYYGRFFLRWYSQVLLDHGDRALSLANLAFEGTQIAVKVSGIHWWYKTASHAAELAAGFYNPSNRDGYAPISQMLKMHNAALNFTCVELRTLAHTKGFPEAMADPEGLVWQVLNAAWDANIPVASENALACYDRNGYNKILENAKPRDDPDGRHLAAFTYLRLNHTLMEKANFAEFDRFVKRMHGEAVHDLQA